MKYKFIAVDELLKENPTNCYSTLRAFRECHRCIKLREALHKAESVDSALKMVKCKPLIKNNVRAYLDLLYMVRALDKKIEEFIEDMDIEED